MHVHTGLVLQTKQNSDILTPTRKKNSGLKNVGGAGLIVVIIDDDQDVYVLVCTRELVSEHTPAVGRHFFFPRDS